MRPIASTAFSLSFILIASLIASMASAQSASDALHGLLEDEWQARLERNPLFATFIGEAGPHDRLPDISPAARAEQLAADRAFLTRLERIDPARLSEADQINHALFERELTLRIEEAQFDTDRIPFRNDSGFHTGITSVLEATPFKSLADYEAYLRRLEAIPGWINQHIANMRRGIDSGWTQPMPVVDRVMPSFQAMRVAAPEESPFFAPLTKTPEQISEADRNRIEKRARLILSEQLMPAVERLVSFMEGPYREAARGKLGAESLPDGKAFYAHRIRASTTLALSAEEIHKIGLEEAERIRARMDAIIDEVGFDGSFAEFLKFLRTDPQFYAETPEQLLKEAAWIAKRVDEKLPAYFATLPRMPYGVRAVPDNIAPGYTTGRYWGAIPGVRGGLFMVNTYNLAQRPLYTLPALAVHEGVPGHHLQISLAKEQGEVPNFRKYGYITAFGEGWGLYTEELAEHMGIYTTPYERFGRLTYEMWRAGRLIVDTGIHAMGWSRERAITFFQENSALAQHNIETEVDRYISWPAQALAYKLGELKILQLRDEAEAALGARYDIRQFHDRVLERGAVTMPMLEQQIRDWIRTEEASG